MKLGKQLNNMLHELDELAAINIMNLHRDKFFNGGFAWYSASGSLQYNCSENIQIGDGSISKCWQPTRNIAQAWILLEKFELFRVYGQLNKIFLVTVHDGSDYYEGAGDTAPEAIVRACLKANG